jgi:GT2 family glycosyltransferase
MNTSVALSSRDVKASVIIPVWNGRPYLRACLEAVLTQGFPSFEIIVVDNASLDRSATFVAENYPQVRLICNQQNLGFAGGCNVGLEAAGGDILVLLNQDTVVQPGWLQTLAQAMEDPDVGVAGCKILEANGKILHHCGGVLDTDSFCTRHRGAGEVDKGQYQQVADVDYVTGAAFAFRRDVLERVGRFDELFFPGYYEDTEYCIRVQKADLRIRYVPDAVVLHHVSTSTRQDWVRMRFYYYRNRMLCILKHLSIDRFVNQFVPSERERLTKLAQGELWAARMALTEVVARWPLLAELLQPDASPGSVEQVLYALRSLSEYVTWQRGRDLDLSPIVQSLGRARQGKGGTVEALLPLVGDMEAIWQIRDTAHTSSRVSSLRTGIRRFYRLLTIGGYRVFLSRQSRFNHLLRRAIALLAANLWDGDSALGLLVEQYGLVAAQVTELQARLAQIERGEATKGD